MIENLESLVWFMEKYWTFLSHPTHLFMKPYKYFGHNNKKKKERKQESFVTMMEKPQIPFNVKGENSISRSNFKDEKLFVFIH